MAKRAKKTIHLYIYTNIHIYGGSIGMSSPMNPNLIQKWVHGGPQDACVMMMID